MDHTSTPWKWHPQSKDQAHTGSVYSEPRQGHAYAVAMMPRYQSVAGWEADASFIVKAVNNHDALVAFARYVLEMDPDSDAPLFAKARKVLDGVAS